MCILLKLPLLSFVQEMPEYKKGIEKCIQTKLAFAKTIKQLIFFSTAQRKSSHPECDNRMR